VKNLPGRQIFENITPVKQGTTVMLPLKAKFLRILARAQIWRGFSVPAFRPFSAQFLAINAQTSVSHFYQNVT